MVTRAEVLVFTPDEVGDLLSSKLQNVGVNAINSFKSNKISGEIFLELNEEDLKELVQPLGERKSIQKLINSYKPKTSTVSLEQLVHAS